MWRRGAVAFVYGGSDSRLSMVTWAIVNLERVEKHYKRPNADPTLFEMGPDELGGSKRILLLRVSRVKQNLRPVASARHGTAR